MSQMMNYGQIYRIKCVGCNLRWIRQLSSKCYVMWHLYYRSAWQVWIYNSFLYLFVTKAYHHDHFHWILYSVHICSIRWKWPKEVGLTFELLIFLWLIKKSRMNIYYIYRHSFIHKAYFAKMEYNTVYQILYLIIYHLCSLLSLAYYWHSMHNGYHPLYIHVIG